VVSDAAWAVFCDLFGLADLKADARLTSNNDRVRARDWMMPLLRERLAPYSAAELSALFEANALPFAPITRPQDLLDDPHLNASGGLAPLTLPDGRETKTVLLPITLDGARPGVRLNPPRLGEHNAEILGALGYSAIEIEALYAR
jgi:crotonobetainyl-CoA:carnitine CoA-transferase CaiB-like acyl-CoA transferase